MATTDVEGSRETDVPDLLPARMLNEFAYCPRLAYLEWVQGEFADNIEVLEGRFAHRRVDEPTRVELPEAAAMVAGCAEAESLGRPQALSSQGASVSGEPDADVQPIHARSVLLSAPREGLIAKIDLIDLENSTAIPVDYKRGRVPDIPGNVWEPEQVQLCAQGLILRENGYYSEGGILYFVESRRRVSVPFTEELVERTRQLAAAFRRVASSGVIPPPLDDSPKCPRCSLVGICLPDETRLLAAHEPDTLAPWPSVGGRGALREVRRLMPARHDALPLYIQEQGAVLGKSGDLLTIKKSDKLVQQVRRIDVSQVALFGNVLVTAQALRDLAADGIPICHFSYGGWFCALTSGLIHKNVELRIAQFAVAADPRRSLQLARRFVVGKIKNSRTLLRRHLDADAGPVLSELAEFAEKAAHAPDLATLLGIEGMAAKLYFAAFARLLKGGPAFNIEGRNRRPPRDPINALLSFVYALLVKELTVVLHSVGFDPMLGFYHRPRYGRPSLALDLAEPFRPLIGDSVVLTLVNNGEIGPGDFVRRAGAVALTDRGRRAVLTAFERRIDTLVTHPIFRYQLSYRRVLEVQARLLARTLLGEIPQYPNFCTR